MLKAHKRALILILLIILFISTLSAVSAQDNSNVDNNKSKDSSNINQFNPDDTGNDSSNVNNGLNDSNGQSNANNNQLNDENQGDNQEPSSDEEKPGDDTSPSNEDGNQITNSDNEDNTMDNNIYYIDLSNYEEYMDYSFEENSIVYITEDIEGLDLFVEQFNVTITGINNPTLKNSRIYVYEEGYSNISNLKFVSDDNSEFLRVINFVGDNNSISNVEFVDYRYEPTDEEYREIFVLGNNTSITNCSFDIRYPSQHRDWRYYGEDCKEIVVLLRGNNNNITNCSISVNESGYYEAPYGMLRGISIYGNNSNASYNKLYLQGTLYCYAISCRGSYNYISYNDIDVVSIRYANGITLEGENAYNIMENNVINLQTFNETIDGRDLVDVSYGIIITENEYHGYTYYIPDSHTIYNVIRNNYIKGNSSHVYGIEQFGGTYTTIENNTIIVEGYTPMGIGLIGKGATITNNYIVARGRTNESGTSADYIKPETTAISLKDGSDNIVANNHLETYNGTSINLRNERRNMITKNEMTVLGNIRYVMGDSKVDGSVFTDNVIEGNPLYSSLNDELVFVKKHTYVDGVIVANSDLESYLATHKQDSNATVQKNDTESGKNENSTDYGNNTSSYSNQTDTNDQPNDNPTDSSTDSTNQTTIGDTNQTIEDTNQTPTTNQSSAANNNDSNTNQTSDDEQKSIIDVIIDKIDEILDTNETIDNTTQNQSTDNNTNEQNNDSTDTNNTKNDTAQENQTQINNTNSTNTDVIIENQTSDIPIDNQTEVPENTTQVIIEEPPSENQTQNPEENITDENNTQDDNSSENNETEEDDTTKNNTQTDNQVTEIIVTNQTANDTTENNTENVTIENQTTDTTQIDTNATANVNDTTDVTKVNTTDKPSLNNTNESQVDTDSPVNKEVTNNTTITNTTVTAEIEVENSTIKNRTNESTGAGDLAPNDGNPSADLEESSSNSQSQPVTLESLMEDIVDESVMESSPTAVGVTQTLSSSNAKVLEVTPKIVSKKMTLDEFKYLAVFMLILMSALILGYKRVEV